MRIALRWKWLPIFLALLGGAALRLWFIHAYPEVQGDPLIYGDIAKNWLLHGVYGLSSGEGLHPTLIRLPGYPLFLALCFLVFGVEHYHAVMYAQTVIDLSTCVIIAAFVRKICTKRAAYVALFLAALCPFTANFAATPLTETLSIFCVALALYSLLRLLERSRTGWLLLLAGSLSFAALLRPDGALLAVAFCPAIFFYGRRSWGWSRALRLALICGVLSVLPFIPWIIRNYRTFGVIQPLAPRYATDPGEFVAKGFIHWTRTWCAEFTSTSEIYWNLDSDAFDIKKLPTRAFDSPAQYQKTQALFADYNRTTTLTPAHDARFESLARERIRGHALRYYLQLPLMRLADMWLRPRTELLWIELRWWQPYSHPEESRFAAAYAAINLAYLAAAVAGLFRRPRLMGAMVAYIVLRCLLLATLEAPEPRYTLECFPIVIAFAALAFRGPIQSRDNRPRKATS
jgi:4-amino-4-deoxy-L-arabinose transferase-like glycosyltransferase